MGSRPTRRHVFACAAAVLVVGAALLQGLRWQGSPTPQRAPRAEGPAASRSLFAKAVLIVSLAVLAFGGVLYRDATRLPELPLHDGRLVLITDRTVAKAALSVAIADPDETNPSAVVIVGVSDPHARFALIGEGSWGFSAAEETPDELGGIRGTVLDVTRTRIKSTGFVRPEISTEVDALIGQVDAGAASPTAVLSLTLRRPLANATLSRQKGYVSPVGRLLGLGTVQLGDRPGAWHPPESARITLTVENFLSFSRIDSVDPLPSQPGMLTWTADDTLQRVMWQITDTDREQETERHLFLAGILIGLAGSALTGALFASRH